MEIAEAVVHKDFKSLQTLVEKSRDNVFDILEFDSFSDERLEKLLFLEGVKYLEDNPLKEYNYKDEQVYKLERAERFLAFSVDLNNNYGLYQCSSTVYGQRTKDIANLRASTHQINFREMDGNNEFKLIIERLKIGLSRYYHYKLIDKSDQNYMFVLINELLKTMQKPKDFKSEYPKFEELLVPFNLSYTVQYKVNDLRLKETFDCPIEMTDYKTSDLQEAREFLLKRVMSRSSTLIERMVEQMKRKFEIERIYFHLKDLYAEDSQLTRSINSKREQLNSLNEEILKKRLELDSVEMRIVNAGNELEKSIQHLKQFEISNEIEFENSFIKLSSEDQHLLECKHLHEYYIQNAEELQIYKFSFEHLEELSQKLQTSYERVSSLEDEMRQKMEEELQKERSTFEKYKSEEEKRIAEEKAAFDKDCETYELESTKWKAYHESRFAKFQAKIDNYDSLDEECQEQKKEIKELKNRIQSLERDLQTTNERCKKLQIAIDIMKE